MRKLSLVVAALLSTPALTRADPPPDPPRAPKVEPAEGAVARVARALAQLRNYQVGATCQGGLARGADHRIGTSTVNEAWRATVAGTVCRVDAPQAFRLRTGQGGAIQTGGRWVAMLATDDGRRLERLFQRPEEVVGDCARLRKLARWVAAEGDAAAAAPVTEEDAAPAEGERGDDGTQARGGAGRRDRSTPAGPTTTSHHIRIEGPPTVALEHFIRIMNSGCFQEG